MCKCNLNSGKTYVNLVTATGGAVTKIIDLTHYLCANRKICCNGTFNPTATINYTTKEIIDVGNSSYFLVISLSGVLNYLPVKSGNCCCATECDCPISEPFYTEIMVDYENAAAPTSYTPGIVVVTPVCNCCSQNTTNAVDIKTSVTITAPTTTTTTTTTTTK